MDGCGCLEAHKTSKSFLDDDDLLMKDKAHGHLAIGISGWTYAPWRDVFFPKKWPQKRELEYASRMVNSIEINGSFYSLQRPTSYRAWYQATPESFTFSVKGPRYITHLRRLRDVETPMANFFASGVLCLKEKLGPILWQLPPSLRYDQDKLEAFLKLLPHDTRQASALAKLHNDKLKVPAATETDAKRPIRHVMEVRHQSFICAEFVEQLRHHEVGLVVADTAGKWPFMEDVTADWVYVRLHGDEELYTSGYTEASLKEWARKIRAWAGGKIPSRTKLVSGVAREPWSTEARDVYVYFDNDVKVHAPFDAMHLAHQLGVGDDPPEKPDLDQVKEEPRQQWPAIPQHWRP